MVTMNFSEIARMLNKVYEETKHMPVAIKVNEKWLEKMMQQSFILRQEGYDPLSSLTGLPVQYDNSINTYEFVYRKDEE
jgi:hypothetical protein